MTGAGTIARAIATAFPPLATPGRFSFVGLYCTQERSGWQLFELRNAFTGERTKLGAFPAVEYQSITLEALRAIAAEKARYEQTARPAQKAPDLHARSVDWVQRALASELPANDSDGLSERAESLVAIAESFHVPMEALVTWIHVRVREKQWSAVEFRGFAKRLAATRAEVAVSASEETPGD